MFKLAGKILDFNDDPGFVLNLKVREQAAQFLKTDEDAQKLPDSSFALVIKTASGTHRRYPIYNAVATRVSCEYFDSFADQLPLELKKTAGYYLQEACKRFQLEAPSCVSKFIEKVAKIHTLTKAPTDASLEPVIKTAESLIKLSELELFKSFHKLEPKDRVEAVSEFCKLAGTEGMTKQELWDYVPKEELGPNFIEGINRRRAVVKQASGLHAELLERIADSAKTETAESVCQTLHTFDKMASLTNRYKNGFPDPYWTCFSGFPLPKVAKQRVDRLIDEAIKPSRSDLSSSEFYIELDNRYPRNSDQFSKIAKLITNIPDINSRLTPEHYEVLTAYFNVG